jgi:Leucine-rich repeat (LRR) protein
MGNVVSDKPIVETIDKSTDDEADLDENEVAGFPDDQSLGDPFGSQEDPGESSDSSSSSNQEIDDEPMAGLATTIPSPNPRYMKYRDTLAKQHYGADTARKLEFNDPEVRSQSESEEDTSNEPLNYSYMADKSPPRYMTYRTRLATASVPEKGSPENFIDNLLSENKQDISQNQEAASLSASPKGGGEKSRFQEYRSTLAKHARKQPDASNVDASEKASRELADGVAGDISREPQYQKYRSHLATSVTGRGQENAGNEREGQDGLVPAHPLTDTPTSAPIYQQYRSALANAILANSTTNNHRPSQVDMTSSESRIDDAKKTVESPLLPMRNDATPQMGPTVTNQTTPRYAAYRTELKDKGPVEVRPDQIKSAAAVTVVSKVAALDPVEDSDLEDRLSMFLSKNEKGKKSEETWSDPVEISSSPHETNAQGPSPDLVDIQARKIAAAIASSQLYRGQEKGGVTPEQKVLEPNELTREPLADPEVARSPDMNSGQPVGVTCRSAMTPRGKRMEDKESDREVGLKLYRRNRCYFHGLLICLLVAMPLGIGLGIALSREDSENRNVQVPIDQSPPTAPNPGLRATPNPTPSPFLETTSMPSSAPTLRPTPTPSTLSPTTESALPTPLTLPPTETPTSLPTMIAVTNAPTSDDQVLFNLISSISVDNGASIETDGSPQNSAFTWLTGSNSLDSFSAERTIQRYALATLFFSTDGPNWSQSSNWLTDVDECLWYSRSGGSSCDENGLYVTLDLGFNGLMGSIPGEIGLLTGLRRLDISGGVGPGIGGALPTTMASLVALETFVATDNAITGSLFNDIGALSNLRILNLKNNDMSGLIPSTVGDLVNLSFMDISFNSFSGPVPTEVGSMANLATLNLGTNAFTSLPASMGNLLNLVTFDASFNSLSGPLFDNWTGLASLRSINLSSNSLTGSLPSSIGSISGLYQLDLSNNRFTSFIPSTYGNLSTLLILRLNSNLLTGNVPAALGNLQLVTEVRVDDNNLEGTVPSQVCDSFEVNAPKFYLDCATPEVSCPPGICCTYCCTDDLGCECVLAGTIFAFLC